MHLKRRHTAVRLKRCHTYAPPCVAYRSCGFAAASHLGTTSVRRKNAPCAVGMAKEENRERPRGTLYLNANPPRAFGARTVQQSNACRGAPRRTHQLFDLSAQ